MTEDEFKRFMIRQGLSADPENYDGQGKTREQDAHDSARAVGFILIVMFLVLIALVAIVAGIMGR